MDSVTVCLRKKSSRARPSVERPAAWRICTSPFGSAAEIGKATAVLQHTATNTTRTGGAMSVVLAGVTQGGTGSGTHDMAGSYFILPQFAGVKKESRSVACIMGASRIKFQG